MMLSFHTRYRPLTSRPFLSNASYREYAPCSALRPYVACFWGIESGEAKGNEEAEVQQVLVIPDTCMDIIIEINHSRQQITSRLCGIQDSPMYVEQRRGHEEVTSFAVRFHFWAASLFLKLNMRDMCNQVLDLEPILPECGRELQRLFYLDSMREKIAWMEDYLLKRVDEINGNPNLYNSIDHILTTSGRASVKEICQYSCVSQRQLERLFQREIGISIKRTASLVRYQNVWRDMVRLSSFDVQDAVYQYGYADQPHLLNEFKRFHGTTPDQARQIALANR